ncbi:hypothetical protein TCAL_13103 [Tigriopus californicus]|uniref:Myosin motor domain-containing protein n=1 Tax=Tigriopus californicus TaxID=6832 RepID=A0A553NSY1_TIGCA|nr:unconventional myosin-Vb-like isoform X4 [Tigriopus californicus]TRY68528.1 hypothetical protein TCAL_13103 [Tigriopus californicus]|eukprot:TCALIF_13103-PA protein Name:"Similar to MYO5B Unconventional myosin-Vb (Homo sapiens)" AED:0.07 eAED:0.07 QI:2/0.88/0.8/1/0.88/0.8/10/109/1244
MAATLGLNKVFILDKYFSELQKYWETEKRLQDATSSGEASNLQNRLRTLSNGLVGLRNSLHENGLQNLDSAEPHPPPIEAPQQVQQNYSNVLQVGPDQTVGLDNFAGSAPHLNFGSTFGLQTADGFSTMRSMQSHVTEVSSVMTGNVSDPSINSADGGLDTFNPGDSGARVLAKDHLVPNAQLSPPQPVNTIQPNYYNIQQPAPVVAGNHSRQSPPQQLFPAHSDSNHVMKDNQGGIMPRSRGDIPYSSNIQSHALPPPPPIPIAGEGGAFSRSAVRPRTPPDERIRKRERDLADEARKSRLAEISDLIHLEPQMTEDAILRTLQARFFNQKYLTNVGPIVLSLNPYRDIGNPLTLSSTRSNGSNPEITKVIQEVIRLQGESGYPQAIIISGSCGSGKTHTSMVVLRQLFESAGGGTETDTFKHLAASFTVLRSLGAAKTTSNRESSRIGHFIEVQVSDGALYRTKIHCYFLDHNRVVKPLPMEKNYHIFYQMLAGLTEEEKKQLGLSGFTVKDLLYLNMGDTRQDEAQDAQRFAEWKANLAVLGIPFMDVIRVMSAILLLGNVEFAPRATEESYDVEIIGKEELNSVSSLLGIPTSLLCQGLTSRTHSVRGQQMKSLSDANLCNATRNALAKALYCRTVATIVRRANSIKRPIGPLSGTMSSGSNESVHHELASHHASTIGTAGSKKSNKSMAMLNNAVRHATDGFIGILDMFGFEDSKPSQLEQLCINLCSETMQHFYNTHIFKSSIESCREEGIAMDVNIEYVDNVPVIDLISSLRSGLLSMLDVECSVRGFPETYVQKVKVQHKDNRKLFQPKHCDINRTFGITHYTGQVVYDTSDFLDTNRDVIPDDLVSVFSRGICNFGFATHLFGNEIKAMCSQGGGEIVPRGVSFRISPTSHPELLNGDEPVSTLTQDFHTRLDNLLRTLVHAKPHFIRCVRPNGSDSLTEFDRNLVVHQIRSLQILETVHLMAKGFPHRMRFKAFNARYRVLARFNQLYRADEKAVDDCEIILDCYVRELRAMAPDTLPQNTSWAHGRKHVFLSEGARQQLERIREERRNNAALRIQCLWRAWTVRRRTHGRLAQTGRGLNVQPTPTNANLNQAGPCFPSHWDPKFNNAQNARVSTRRPRPQPISGTPPPDLMQTDRCDLKIIQQTCALFGLDLERPPPIPPSRSYSIVSGKKVTFPQTRLMKMQYPDNGKGDILLLKGDAIVVLGVSTRRGHLIVEKMNQTLHVPFHYLEMGPL